MTSPEGGYPERSRGGYWLSLLGSEFEDLSNMPTLYTRDDGTPILARDFDELCGDHAERVFATIEELQPDDPMHEAYLAAAQEVFKGHMPKETIEHLLT